MRFLLLLEKDQEQIQPLIEAFAISPSTVSFDAVISTLHVSLQDQKLSETIGWLRNEAHHLFDPTLGSSRVLGCVWVALALLMIDLYVPNLPMDPVAGNHACVNILHRRLQRLQQEIQLLQAIENSRTGHNSNLLVERLLHRLSEVELEISAQPHAIKRDTDVVHLQELFTEIHQFQTRVLTSASRHKLMGAMIFNPSEATAIESTLQESIMNFQQRLKAVYSRFADIVIPLDEWLMRLRFGLRMIREDRATSRKSDATPLAQSITTFPSAIAALRIRASVNITTTLGDKEFTVLRLQAIEHEILLGVHISQRQTELGQCFDELFRIWMKEQKEKARRDAENGSLYRGGTSKNEVELEEVEFMELFPQYDDVMGEYMTGTEPEDGIFRLNTATISRIFATLMQKDRSFSPSGHILAASFATKWLPSVITQLPMSLDRHSVIWSLRYLQDYGQRFLRSPAAQTYNFYKDVNTSQTSRVIPILLSLRDRLSGLIDLWPDQMVLQHLRERCDAILNLNVDSPVPRILAALEQLLLQIEDWERYAYQENTIKEWQSNISSLVVEWRRLELSGWAQLLNHEHVVCVEGTPEWWFRIYEATVYGTRAAVLEGKIDHHLSSLLPLLESFLISSSIGEYPARLQLLRNFGGYTSLLTTSGQDGHDQAMAHVSRLLEAVSCFYGRFSSQISSSFDQQRVELDKEIDSFIKLASWKDVNVFSLKASARRTHHQLYKSIKKFRQILRQPVTPYLDTKLLHSPGCYEGVTRPMSEPVPTAPDLQFPAPVPAHRQHLNSTLSRFDTLLQSILPKLHLSTSVATEDFVNSIIEINQELATAVPPKEVKDASKWNKNLLTRKKTAFAKLLKTCKLVGLSDSIQASVLERHQNRVLLYEQRRPFPETESAYRFPVAKADLYFDRILTHLPKYEASLASHSSDISTRELTRLRNCAHSTLSRGLLTRDLCVPSLVPLPLNADLVHSLFEAAAVSEQLRAVSLDISLANDGDALVLVGDSAFSYANSHMEALCYVVAALEEILLYVESLEVFTISQPLEQPAILVSLQKQKGILQVRRDYALTWIRRASTTCLPLLWQREPWCRLSIHRYSHRPQIKHMNLNRPHQFTKPSLNCKPGVIKTMWLCTVATAFSLSSTPSSTGYPWSRLVDLMAPSCQLLNIRSIERW
jgi:midasin